MKDLVVHPYWHRCSPVEDALLTVGTFLLALAPVLIVFAFAVL